VARFGCGTADNTLSKRARSAFAFVSLDLAMLDPAVLRWNAELRLWLQRAERIRSLMLRCNNKVSSASSQAAMLHCTTHVKPKLAPDRI
jgi:hypothetical protein